MMAQQYGYGNSFGNSGLGGNSGDNDDDLYEGFNYSIDLAPPQTSQNQGYQTYNTGVPGTGYRYVFNRPFPTL